MPTHPCLVGPGLQEVEQRFGLLPQFFSPDTAAPALLEPLWLFARTAYLDNPLPSVFKERLFVHLSRFSEARYCVARHAGFLAGLGYPAGDRAAATASVRDVLKLVGRPVPDRTALDEVLARLEDLPRLAALPAPGSALEGDLFDALAAVFVDTRRTSRTAALLRPLLGGETFDRVMTLLAFIRAAHFWTRTHPEITLEPDVLALLRQQPPLAELLLDDTDARLIRDWHGTPDALQELRASLRETQERQAFMLKLSDVLRPLSDPAEVQRAAVRLLGEHLGASRCHYAEATEEDGSLQCGPCYCKGVPPLAGLLRIADFSVSMQGAFRHGATRVIVDVAREPLAHQAGLLAAQVRAAVAVPLVKAGRLVAVLAVHQSAPRYWTQAQVRLIEEVADRTWAAAERASAEAALREADRRKDEFLATMAHELRNPLAPISNALQLLRVAPDKPTAERVHAMLDRQVQHMVRLLDELLEVSRISRGVIELRRERLDLAAVVHDAVQAARPQIEQGGHALEVTLPDEPVVVEGDEMRLVQVLVNLLSNAARYTDPGGSIRLGVRRDAAQVRVAVEDSGIGIAPERLAGVFAMFGQLNRDDPRSQGGLGIGLALAQRLAQMHGGSIEAASGGLGLGSRFTLKLPLATGAPPAAVTAPAPVTTAPQPRGRRVVVVDDNRDNADTTALLLGAFGAEVQVAYDGLSGLAEIEAWRPQVVLLDLGLPGLDGCEVARRLRTRFTPAEMTLIALTGWGQADDRERTREAGFDHHLVKPVAPGVIEALLEQAAGDPGAPTR